eukprot:m.351408 g.351408  ORF g.351408 m.351408 type:complete len:209 (-) comp16241_c0_seq1:1800-2426(-)
MWGRKKVDPKEAMKQHKRELQRTERGMDREAAKLQREEAKLEAQIKAAAKKGDKQMATLLAKQLIQMRKARERQVKAKSQVTGVRLNASTMQATHTMAQSIGSASKVMGKMNAQMDPAKTAAVMQGFQQEMAKMDMGQEMMDDAFEGLMEDSDVEEESNAILDEVLTGINMGVASQAGTVPSAAPQVASGAAVSEEDQLMARLAQLGH